MEFFHKIINIRVSINILEGKLSNEIEFIGKKIWFLVKKTPFWVLIPKTNKLTVQNKIVLVGNMLKINKRMLYVYLEP